MSNDEVADDVSGKIHFVVHHSGAAGKQRLVLELWCGSHCRAGRLWVLSDLHVVLTQRRVVKRQPCASLYGR